jgi:hypothetical protein
VKAEANLFPEGGSQPFIWGEGGSQPFIWKRRRKPIFFLKMEATLLPEGEGGSKSFP